MKKAEPADFPRFEADMLKIWEKEKTFEQSVKNREGQKRVSFYDGPPFANGLPHYGHILAATIKDSITRYKTMRGYYVPRRLGWDTHGLPVEYHLEQELKISGKRQIVEMGIDKFNQAARDSVFRYRGVFEDLYRRIGRWADMQNSYATLDDNYIESVWWVVSELYKKDLVYRGFRSAPYCPRCATPLSNFEVNQNYKDNVPDPSVYVKFQVEGYDKTFFLAWTTTPWTLPANAALAIDADADYAIVKLLNDGDGWKEGDKLILAKDRLKVLDLSQTEYKVLNIQKGKTFLEVRYRPLYDLTELSDQESERAFQVYADTSVSLEDGTGVLHVAPRYGETDLELGQREGLPLIESVDGDGHMTADMGEFAGMWFKDADVHVVADLTKQGRIFAAETAEHTYPFCWRCETPLMYFAMPSWYVKVGQMQKKLVKTNNQINWVPDHIKQGRFGNWLAEARDWNFSRNRFWGAPLPIWVNEQNDEDIIVVGSLEELRKLSGHKSDFDLHRPGIDEVVIMKEGKTYRRVEEVLDCWFESGSMPYAEDHYPFEHKKEFETAFPAEFIAEGLDQTRGWFYTLHVLATALFDAPAFKNVIVNGQILAADGKKLSKRLRNYPEPAQIFDRLGADSLRYFLLSSPVAMGEDVRFSDEGVNEVCRNVFTRLWNVHSFFTTYAEVDKWSPKSKVDPPAGGPKSDNVLDQWILARLNHTIVEMTSQADSYQIARAVRPLRDLVDDLSNWYVRRSRRRFWKSEDDGDKQAAYQTLHYVLVRTSQLLAPWSPFMADKLWRELTTGMDVPASVHLSDWPEAGEFDKPLLTSMASTRDIITRALAQRAEAGIKVRQPLPEVKIWMWEGETLSSQLSDIIGEEVNVKKVEVVGVKEAALKARKHADFEVELNIEIDHDLKLEGLARDIIRAVQAARKAAGLQVDDRISLSLSSKNQEVEQAIKTHEKLIAAETLAVKMGEVSGHEHIAKVSGGQLKVVLHKEDV